MISIVVEQLEKIKKSIGYIESKLQVKISYSKNKFEIKYQIYY
jgi:hypothetical protein